MIKRNKEVIDYIFSLECSRDFRIKYFENDFLSFCLYYFPAIFFHRPADFQYEYIDDLQMNWSIFFVGFRECSKTTLLKIYYIWMIIYKKRHYLVHYNSDVKKAKSFLFSLTFILQKNRRIIKDFGYLYHSLEGRKVTDVTKKTIGEFMIGESIKVEAMSIGTSPRGMSFTAVVDGEMREFRVDFVSMDDIDNDKNLGNPEIIEEDVNFILGEVLGGVSSFCQKVFLGNIITEDSRVLRLKKHFENNPKMKIYWIPIRNKGKITWERFVATDKEAEEKNNALTLQSEKEGETIDPTRFYISLESKRREQGSIGFNQNFNLIPYKSGQKIIGKTFIKYWYDRPDKVRVIMGIDGALSEKTLSDSFGITITAHYTNTEGKKFKYILGSWELKGPEKSEEKYKVFVREKYHKYGVNLINIESQGGGLAIGPVLKKEGLAVNIEPTTKDKVQHLLEYQGDFERGEIYFAADMEQDLEKQLLEFPNGKDDLVDSMLQSFRDKKIGGFTTSAK